MRYTSDLTDSQWEIIKPILQEARYRSIEEKREQMNAVFYLVKTGCQWRNLPKDFPKGKTVYRFYKRTCMNGIWDKIQKALVKKVRVAKGKNEAPSYALIDSQSTKTIAANQNRGYDGGKTKGRKRHIVTDTMGNLLCVHVHAGNIHDTKGGVYTFEKALYHYPTIVGVRADQRDRGTFKNTFEIYHDIKVDISPRIKNEFEIQPVRWVVERTFGWMTWSRRLSKDYEIKTFYQEDICIISNL